MSDPELWKQMQVKDVCTKPALSISPDASVLDAMKVLVEKRISGLPVADESGHVVGVISGYDLLLLESTPGHIDTSEGLFPPIGRCDEYGGKKELMWNSFNELRNAQARVRGESVGDVMHECTTISQDASLEDAASVLLANKQHRLAVVDDDGKLCGILSRGDILRSTLESLQGYCTFEA
ncbi:CBS domain-containing protein [Pseudoscourfieldia marina]